MNLLISNFCRIFLIIVLFGNFIFGISQQKTPEVFTIINANAHIGNGKYISNCLIICEKGRITDIGQGLKSKGIIIDAQNKEVYPGFIAPNTSLGLVEIDAVKASKDELELGEFNPHIRSIVAYNSESKIIPTVRANGVLIAQIVPQGGIISGTSSIVNLDARNWEGAILKKNDGIHLKWPQHKFNLDDPLLSSYYSEEIQKLHNFFELANVFIKTSNPKSPDLVYEAMRGVFQSSQKVFVHAQFAKQIIDAYYFLKNFGINNIVVIGGAESYKIVDFLKTKSIGVLLRRTHDLPFYEHEDYDMPFKQAKILLEKGVLVGLENSGDMERMQTRNLGFLAGSCVAEGLDKEKALQLITLNTAKLLGIEGVVGSLEKGKLATFFISKGDALDISTNEITQAFIEGKEVNLNTYHKELYQKYKE